ncbi:MAG TPA: alginate lyase family protein [Pyrinomonadaceae bacterium]
MTLLGKFKRALRGEVEPKTVVREAVRRAQVQRWAAKERTSLDSLNAELPKLWLSKKTDLLSHFQNRRDPHFFPGFTSESLIQRQQELFPAETEQLLNAANQIVDQHAWPLLGFGLRSFGNEIEWSKDPLSGFNWPLVYHRDLQLIRNDGSDARVLWELNRLGHLLTLARAYVITNDEKFSAEAFAQIRSWANQNPYGRGVNWNCAMEVALRAMNLIAIFELLKKSIHFNIDVVQLFLRLFHQHGTYIRNNPEFSYVSTSNHYLSDVAGLLWLGIMLPEFVDGEGYCDSALVELLKEMNKQVLPDGADFESSTGYHRYALELFLYSFILCKHNDYEIEERYWKKLHSMLVYLRGYLRPDGSAPLIGDTDSGQVLPLRRRRADEHEYLLTLGAALFKDASLKTPNAQITPELLWLLGPDAVEEFRELAPSENRSMAFHDAGTYVMRRGNDRYLCFNASGAGINGRGSHGHNDSLSIEVFANNHAFIVDPGTFVYTADLKQRNLFRSTAYHSTVKIDGAEQNTTHEALPFIIGNEAHPRVLGWESNDTQDRIVAEHSGYSIVHRRTIVFDKNKGEWSIEDEFLGEGEHSYEVRFHFAPDLDVRIEESLVIATDGVSQLRVAALDKAELGLEVQACSSDYGEKQESVTACWKIMGKVDRLRWKIEVA